MQLPKSKDLLDTLDRIVNTEILVTGDLMLDRYIWGKVSRISPEAPVPVVDVTRTEDRLGGAGNVVQNLRSIKAKVSVCAYVGSDEEGKQVKWILDESGVSTDGLITDSSRPTTLKTRVIAHHQQVVRIDREESQSTASKLDTKFTETVAARLKNSKGIILSDYGKGAITPGLLAALEDAQKKGILGIGTCPYMVDPHPKNHNLYKRLNVAKPNKREAEVASGITIENVDDAFRAARKLLEIWRADMMLVTLSEDGLVIIEAGKEKGIHLETHAQEIFDVSGAGDTVTALFTASLAVGAPPIVAGVLANIGAGIVVSEVGTAAVDLERLRDEAARFGKGD